LSTRAQTARLRRVAIEALTQYPIDVARLRVINHAFNTTFRVDAVDGRTFALRVNVNSRRSPANIGAEIAWLAALANDTDLVLPNPQRTRDGALCTQVFSVDLQRALPAVLFTWLPGPDLGEAATVQQMRATGAATAVLHQHASGWSLPEGTELSSIDSVLMDVPNRLAADHPLISADRRAVIDAAFAAVQPQYDALFAGARRQVLHADLHVWNLKWYRGRLAVFDFDDCGIGVPAQDLAISSYYLRDNAEQEAALLEGYEQVQPLPAFTAAQFEAQLAGRNLVLLNDVIASSTAEYRAMMPRYVANTVTKLRHYLDTGVFRHDIPGLIAST
jgi:Ser/Thr protein kinase RdoA (MazF antagonist)